MPTNLTIKFQAKSEKSVYTVNYIFTSCGRSDSIVYIVNKNEQALSFSDLSLPVVVGLSIPNCPVSSEDRTRQTVCGSPAFLNPIDGLG